MSREPMTDDSMVAALLRERDAYQRQHLPDRVAQVDEQLRLRGYEDPEPDKTDPPKVPPPAQKAAGRDTPPKGRRSAPRETA